MSYSAVRKLLFTLDPEHAHAVSLGGLRMLDSLGLANVLSKKLPDLPAKVMGLEFKNPVGLAAGLDKDGDYIDALSSLGFGFIEIGTVTPRPQPGNPRPRIFRLPEYHAIINRMGFNNKGVDYLVQRVQAARFDGVLGINIGKNVDTPVDRALDDYLICLRRVYPYASYITVNISSPNTPGLRDLQLGDSLDQLLVGIRQEREKLSEDSGEYKPIAIKIAPDMTNDQVVIVANRLVENSMDAVIATNTTLSRVGVEGSVYESEAGGLSGRPIHTRSTSTIQTLARVLQGELPIIGVGGIDDAVSAKQKLASGASLLQIYTGFIYEGPGLIGDIIGELSSGTREGVAGE